MLTEEKLQAIEARSTLALREGWDDQTTASCQDVPVLLAEVKRLKAENDRLRCCGNCRHYGWVIDDDGMDAFACGKGVIGIDDDWPRNCDRWEERDADTD
jgi:hypothetical protein